MSGNSSQGDILKVTSGEAVHYITRAHVVDIIVRGERALASDGEGGTRPAEPGDAIVRPASFEVEIVTLAPGSQGPYRIKLRDDEARQLQAERDRDRDRVTGLRPTRRAD